MVFKCLRGVYVMPYKPSPLGTRRCCDVESTSMTLIQRRNNVVCPVGGDKNVKMRFSVKRYLAGGRNSRSTAQLSMSP